MPTVLERLPMASVMPSTNAHKSIVEESQRPVGPPPDVAYQAVRLELKLEAIPAGGDLDVGREQTEVKGLPVVIEKQIVPDEKRPTLHGESRTAECDPSPLEQVKATPVATEVIDRTFRSSCIGKSQPLEIQNSY
jgi:hypothetical protein